MNEYFTLSEREGFMSRLLMTQEGFTLMVGKMIVYAYKQGYGLTFGDAYATDGHMDNSNHYRRLAVDFNLIVNGVYITSSSHPAWLVMHSYFEQLGGGRMISNDAGHFSVEWNGIL